MIWLDNVSAALFCSLCCVFRFIIFLLSTFSNIKKVVFSGFFGLFRQLLTSHFQLQILIILSISALVVARTDSLLHQYFVVACLLLISQCDLWLFDDRYLSLDGTLVWYILNINSLARSWLNRFKNYDMISFLLASRFSLFDWLWLSIERVAIKHIWFFTLSTAIIIIVVDGVAMEFWWFNLIYILVRF